MTPKALIRAAKIQDSNRIWEIRNDPKNRSFMHATKAIAWKTHDRWFRNYLQSRKGFFFVLEAGSNVIGYLRFDKSEAGTLKVAIALDSSRRGKGYGYYLLSGGLKKLPKHITPAVMTAEVKNFNLASQRLFEKCGFSLKTNEKECKIYVYGLQN